MVLARGGAIGSPARRGSRGKVRGFISAKFRWSAVAVLAAHWPRLATLCYFVASIGGKEVWSLDKRGRAVSRRPAMVC